MRHDLRQVSDATIEITIGGAVIRVPKPAGHRGSGTGSRCWCSNPMAREMADGGWRSTALKTGKGEKPILCDKRLGFRVVDA